MRLFDRRDTRLSATETRFVECEAPSAFEALVEFLYLTPVGIIRFRPDGQIDMANPMAAQLLMPLAADADMTDLYRLFAVIAPDLSERVGAFTALSGTICEQMQLRLPSSRQVLTLGINKINADTLMAVVQDITRAVEQETRIRDDQQRFRAIFDNVRDYAIYTVDPGGRIDEWNRSLNRIGGWLSADLLDRLVDVFFSSAGGSAAGTALLDRARRHGTAEYEGWCLRRDGSVFWGNTVATVLPDLNGNPNGFVLVTRDLTDRKHIEDRLVALATTDSLTGALNRRAGDDKLAEGISRWKHHGCAFSVLIVDCDHFKNVNDRWGHETGDKVLVALVRLCQEKLRGSDSLIRWGGEEFLLLLSDTARGTALTVAERVRETFEQTDVVNGRDPIRITLSIGVAEVQEGDTHADDVVRRADQALYVAKKSGRNRVAAM